MNLAQRILVVVFLIDLVLITIGFYLMFGED